MTPLIDVKGRSARSILSRCAHVALALAAACCAVAAHAADAEEPAAWALSGFGTVGLTSKSGASGWGYARDQGQKGASGDVSAAVDSRAGVQLNWNGGPRWDGAAQLVLRDRPFGAHTVDSLEWAYVTHHPTPDLGLRVGRTSPDIFLFANTRNVGVALPWARPPVDFYGFIPLSSMDGADVSQQWSWAGADWRTRIGAGRFETQLGALPTDDPLRLTGRDVLAATLSREADGLLIKASYLRARTTSSATPGFQQLQDGLDQLGQLPVPGLAGPIDALRSGIWSHGTARYISLGVQYEAGPWSIHTEGSDVRIDGSGASGRRGYVSLGYRWRTVTPYALASRTLPTRGLQATPDLASLLTPVLGPALGQQAQMLAAGATDAANLGRFDQRTLAVGLRWDATPNTALKAQVDRIHTHPNGAGGWRHSDARAADATVVTVLVDFAWGP